MKFAFCVLTILLSFSAWAKPGNFEVWFLSESTASKSTWINQIIKPVQFSSLLAQSNLQCQPMGDYCFDPQVGLYKKGDENSVKETVNNSEFEQKQKYDFMDPAKSVDREMIDCDKASFFDMFCGKAQKAMKKGKSKLEIWIDTSSTMKQIDFGGFDQKCSRERFLEDLSQTCPMNQKMKVYTFDDVRKELGAFDRVCLSNGLNDMKKLMRDLDQSQAENVIIITDIFEAESSFIEAIEMRNGIIKGLDKPLYANQIHKDLKRIRKFCQ